MPRRKSHGPVSMKELSGKKDNKPRTPEEFLAIRRKSMPVEQALMDQALFKISDTVKDICTGLPVNPLPKLQVRSKAVQHAPIDIIKMSPEEEQVPTWLFVVVLLSCLIYTVLVFEPEYNTNIKSNPST